MCWKLVRKYEKFERCFINLGMNSPLSSSLFSTLQQFVSILYGTKLKSVNEARYAIFEKKRQKEKKIIDMAALPLCESVLHLHSKGANAVAYMWRNAVNPIVEFPNLEITGWYLNGDIQWVDDVFPPTIEQLLSDEISENESDSDDEEMENIKDEVIYGSDIDSDYETFG